MKRENVNQVEAHRDRLGFGPDIPGVLLVNSQMDVVGIANRKLDVAPEHIRHAKLLNVTVVLTSDLVKLMQVWEAIPRTERGGKLLELTQQGGMVKALRPMSNSVNDVVIPDSLHELIANFPHASLFRVIPNDDIVGNCSL